VFFFVLFKTVLVVLGKQLKEMVKHFQKFQKGYG